MSNMTMNIDALMREKTVGIDDVKHGQTSYEDYLVNQLRMQMHGLDGCMTIYRGCYYGQIAKLSTELAHLKDTRCSGSNELYRQYLSWVKHMD